MKEQDWLDASYHEIWCNPSSEPFKCLLRKRITGDNGEILYCLDIYACVDNVFYYKVAMFRQDETMFCLTGSVTGGVKEFEEQVRQMYTDLKCIPDIHCNKKYEIKILPMNN